MNKRDHSNFLQRSESQSGQALVETALVFIIAVLFLAGLIEFGWAYFHYLALQSAAGEGAAYGIVYPTWQDSADNPDPNNITYRVQHESNSTLLDWSSTVVTVDAPFLTPGNHITVTVTYDYDPITPLLTPFLSGDSMTLSATAVQQIVSPSH